MATRAADFPCSVRANRDRTKKRLRIAYSRASDQKIANADRGISAFADNRSNRITTATDIVTPLTTVNMDWGPMNRITARYRPSIEKTTREALIATRKYAAVRSITGSIRSNLRIRAAQRAT